MTAKRSPAVRPSSRLRPSATPRASLKWPASAVCWKAKAAVTKRAPAPEAAAGGDGDEGDGGDGHGYVPAHAEVAEGQADADELGRDGEEVQQEEVADGEGAPEPAEALDDEPGVADAGDGTQPHDHL